MKRKLTPRFRISLGLAGLVVSLMLTAMLIGLVPDQQSEIRRGRAALAESIALSTSQFVTKSETERLKQLLEVLVRQNDDLLSTALRRQGGLPIAIVGRHEFWQAMVGDFSTASQVQVPIYSNGDRWGQLELRFRTQDKAEARFAGSRIVTLIIFMSAGSFLAFYLYMGKMLTQLDPSQAIPQRVRSALDTMAEGLLVVDRRGRIVLANTSFAEICDCEVDELLGRRATDFAWRDTDGELIPLDEAPWVQCLATGKPTRDSPLQLHFKEIADDYRLSFHVNCTPVMSSGGKQGDRCGGVLVSFDDVTQLELKKLELGRAKEEADEANLAKSQFLANMSHEIRTPMNAILGFTEILRRGYGVSKRDPRKYLDTIHSSGKHLLNLINDILDLSKVEAGKLEVEQVMCAPHTIVHDVVQVLSMKAQEKGIELQFTPDAPLPATITSDPSRLQQIITNLVGNAIKFTETGGVYLSAVVDAERELLQVEVRDTGIGMTAEQVRRIFDPFSQADVSVTRRFGGTGLGLSISLRFAEALGGNIRVESTPGEGSKFILTVATGELDGIQMLEPSELESDATATAGTVESWKFDSGRVLVVDDGIENRELVSLLLKQAGLEVVGAENGQEGVDAATREHFDLILMDMQMPVMDGPTATRTLRGVGITTPVYALTANAMQGFERECLEAGCNGFLTKPIDIDLLYATISKELGGNKFVEELPAFEIEAPRMPGTKSDEVIEAEEDGPLYSTLPDDPEFRSIVAEFTVHLRERLGEMQMAIDAADFESLARLAHWLKGSGGSVGFGDFTALAKALEQGAKEQDVENCERNLKKILNVEARIRLLPSTDEVSAETDSDGNSQLSLETPNLA